jgi:lysophospholipid acyltransferase (LPLAT)-like uncharacterized protein
MLKQLLASPVVQFLLGRAMGLYMRFVGWTTRWEHVDRSIVEQVWAGGGPVIACIWHGRLSLVHKGWRFPNAQTPRMLISQSREGGVVAHVSRTVGADVIRGSSAKPGKRGKGGLAAFREMIRHLQADGCMCMTPDGPRGPRMRAQLGPIQLAKLTGAPILVLAWALRRRKVFQSWDRFVLPGPFGKGVFVWGGLIHVAKDADDATMERARLELEDALNRVSREADLRAGVRPIEPAPVQDTAPTAALAEIEAA